MKGEEERKEGADSRSRVSMLMILSCKFSSKGRVLAVGTMDKHGIDGTHGQVHLNLLMSPSLSPPIW